jgi:hypothetical protein
MIDSDLAALYGVETKALNQAVRRNLDRFPNGFMFRMTNEDAESLRSQIVTSSWGGRRYVPYAFTEHGVAMLSSVLRSRRALEVNIAIVRTFVTLRQMLATNEELARLVAQHDHQITVLFEHVQKMLAPARVKKSCIGPRCAGRRVGDFLRDHHAVFCARSRPN